jgi:hypothetical protein
MPPFSFTSENRHPNFGGVHNKHEKKEVESTVAKVLIGLDQGEKLASLVAAVTSLTAQGREHIAPYLSLTIKTNLLGLIDIENQSIIDATSVDLTQRQRLKQQKAIEQLYQFLPSLAQDDDILLGSFRLAEMFFLYKGKITKILPKANPKTPWENMSFAAQERMENYLEIAEGLLKSSPLPSSTIVYPGMSVLKSTYTLPLSLIGKPGDSRFAM